MLHTLPEETNLNPSRAVRIGVVHLVRAGADPELFRRFLESYQNYPGGIAHEFLIVYKGFEAEHPTALYSDLLNTYTVNTPRRTLSISDVGFDLNAYHAAAQHFDHDYFCFLNSYTQLRDPAWLAKMYAQVRREGVGIVGASGSWETFVPPLAHERARLAQRGLVGRLKGQIRLTWQRALYPAFPNPHLRTNGFVLSRKLLLQLRGMTPRSKAEAWRFENARHNMTRQIQQKGLRTLVVGCDGIGYEIEAWPRSNTFRQGDQSNLLMTDNRTEEYDEGTNEERLTYWIWAWQEQAIPPTPVDPQRAANPHFPLQPYAPLALPFNTSAHL